MFALALSFVCGIVFAPIMEALFVRLMKKASKEDK